MPLPDFLLIAAVGRVLRWLQLDGGSLSAENLSACGQVGRGDVVEPEILDRAIQAAGTFWLRVMFAGLGLGLALVVIVAAMFGRTALGHPLSSWIFGTLMGVAAWGGFQFAFAMHSARYLTWGRLGPPRPEPIAPWAVAAAKPRLHASVISMLGAILVAAAAIHELM